MNWKNDGVEGSQAVMSMPLMLSLVNAAETARSFWDRISGWATGGSCAVVKRFPSAERSEMTALPVYANVCSYEAAYIDTSMCGRC